MCGIFGFAKKEGPLTELDRYKLQGAVMDLAYHNESRGKDGTGIGLLSSSKLTIFKEAKSASALLRTKRFRKAIWEIGEETTILLSHTRYATVGSIQDRHCHPFVSEEFVGAHNGHFTNREAVLKKYARTQETPVDSEAIFRVLDGEKEFSGIAKRLEEMEGDFGLAFARKDEPHSLYLLRNDGRPLHVAYLPRMKALIFSSERKHLEFALLRNRLKAQVWEIQRDHLYCAAVSAFGKKSHMKKVPCKIRVPVQILSPQTNDPEFHVNRAPYLFSYQELESFDLLRDSEINERSKIPCAYCEKEAEAGKLFFDEMSGQFFCEECSFDYLDDWEEERRFGADDPEETIEGMDWSHCAY